MKATFDQHIGIFENAVPKEWCENIINLFESNSNQIKSRQEAENIAPTFKKDEMLGLQNVNKSLCEEFNYHFFNDVFPLYMKEYQLADIYDLPLILSDFKLQKTLPTGGYHVWHIENLPNTPSKNRVMVYTLYLNDVEEGGETEFLIQSKRIKPKQGTICIFPASYTHIHRGNPPLSGTKYIMTGWIEPPINNSYTLTNG